MVKVYVLDVSTFPDPKECEEVMSGLSEDRVEKILRYRKSKDRKQSLGAGLLLKQCLSEYNIRIEDIRYGEHGKPEIDGVYFNLSHSHDMVVCGVSERRIGCDIEKIEDVRDGIAERFFTKSEIQYLNQYEGDEKKEEFYRLWTMKESYMKMTGEGMSLALDRFEFSFKDRICVCRDGKKCDCHLKEYEIPGYKLTVCAEENVFASEIEIISREKLFCANL